MYVELEMVHVATNVSGIDNLSKATKIPFLACLATYLVSCGYHWKYTCKYTYFINWSIKRVRFWFKAKWRKGEKDRYTNRDKKVSE